MAPLTEGGLSVIPVNIMIQLPVHYQINGSSPLKLKNENKHNKLQAIITPAFPTTGIPSLHYMYEGGM